MFSSKNVFSLDFYLIKFVEDNVRIVLSSDKVKIKDEDVEAGSACEAYWEDTQIKGWFPAIILAFGGTTVSNISLIPIHMVYFIYPRAIGAVRHLKTAIFYVQMTDYNSILACMGNRRIC